MTTSERDYGEYPDRSELFTSSLEPGERTGSQGEHAPAAPAPADDATGAAGSADYRNDVPAPSADASAAAADPAARPGFADAPTQVSPAPGGYEDAAGAAEDAAQPDFNDAPTQVSSAVGGYADQDAPAPAPGLAQQDAFAEAPTQVSPAVRGYEDAPADAGAPQTAPQDQPAGGQPVAGGGDGGSDPAGQAATAGGGHGKRWGLIGVGVLVLILIIAGGAYGGYYAGGNRALPGTKIGNVAVGGLNRGQIVAALNRAAGQARIDISGQNIANRTASFAQLGLAPDTAQLADRALARTSQVGAYFTAPFTTTKIDPQLNTDGKKLADYAAMLTQGVPGTYPATEPSVAPAPDKTKFVAVPGKDGRGVSLTGLVDTAKQALGSSQPAKLTAQIGDVKPLIGMAEAQKRAEAANALVTPQLQVKVGDADASPSPAQRVAWVRVPQMTADAKPQVDPAAVKAWVQQVSGKLVVKKQDGVRYKNDQGAVVLVKRQAKDGVDVTNVDQLSQQIVTQLNNRQAVTGAVETKPVKADWQEKVIAPGAENLAYPAAPDEKWIDVNLSNHTATAYQGATVVHGPVSMVNGAPDTPTAVGTFAIERKYRSKTMKGRNADGSNYTTPDVPNAMYFHEGYALHGAPWRSSFGYAGSRGSHGCVNLPVSESSWFFGWAPMGTPVVTHY